MLSSQPCEVGCRKQRRESSWTNSSDLPFSRDAAAEGHMTCCPAEKSGQDEFDFEYGQHFADHINALVQRFVRFWSNTDPEGELELNRRQTTRLKRLSDYLHAERGRSMFMFELLVPAEKAQMDRLNGDHKKYDLELRPRLMAWAIEELQDGGVEPDVWKIEGLGHRDDCERIVTAARRNGRDSVGCIVLGRGEDDTRVREWLTTAATVPGFIGFAVGRTSFWDPLVNWRSNKISYSSASSPTGPRSSSGRRRNQ